MDDTRQRNREVWNQLSREGVCWGQVVSKDLIDRARQGELVLTLATKKAVPKNWFPQVKDTPVLCLASGGGQQGPLLAAAGAKVTVVDISEVQLEKDQKAAADYKLEINTVRSSADDLSMLCDEAFDLIVHPVSNCYFPKLEPVWQECWRVLKKGGRLLYGFNNPLAYQFDYEKANRGEYTLKYQQPYSDLTSLSVTEKKRFLYDGTALEFGHSLTEQIGALLRRGFIMRDMYEEGWGEVDQRGIDHYFPQFICVYVQKEHC